MPLSADWIKHQIGFVGCLRWSPSRSERLRCSKWEGAEGDQISQVEQWSCDFWPKAETLAMGFAELALASESNVARLAAWGQNASRLTRQLLVCQHSQVRRCFSWQIGAPVSNCGNLQFVKFLREKWSLFCFFLLFAFFFALFCFFLYMLSKLLQLKSSIDNQNWLKIISFLLFFFLGGGFFLFGNVSLLFFCYFFAFFLLCFAFFILVCTTQKGLHLGKKFWNPHFGKYSPKSPRSTIGKSFGNITSTRVQQAQHFFAVP